MESLEEKIRRMPQDLQKEVMDFVDFLLSRHEVKPKKKLSFECIEGLKEYRNHYTALELQKKASEWVS
jgi:hypothetical protein